MKGDDQAKNSTHGKKKRKRKRTRRTNHLMGGTLHDHERKKNEKNLRPLKTDTPPIP